MESKYSARVDCATQVSTTTKSTELTSKYGVEESGTVIKSICTTTAFALLALTNFVAQPDDLRLGNTQVQTTVSISDNANYSIALPKNAEHIKSSLITESQKLQKEFSFKTAQWAAVLQVERKTLYNWIKNPETKVHDKVANRITIFNKLFEEMDTGHAHYLASFAFGRYKDAEIGNLLIDENLSFNEIVEHYERLYSEFDGKHKRNKHKYSQYS
jgi:hypothetical protein